MIKEKELTKALIIGEQSGFFENFDFEKHLEVLHSKIIINEKHTKPIRKKRISSRKY